MAGGGCVVAMAENGIGDVVLELVVVPWIAMTGVGYSKQTDPQGALLQEVGQVDDEDFHSAIDNNIVPQASFVVAEPTSEGYSYMGQAVGRGDKADLEAHWREGKLDSAEVGHCILRTPAP